MLSWLSVDARTGVVLADLPNLDVESVKCSLGRYESTMASLPLPTAPENWLRATLSGGSNLILLQDDTPIWGGMVTKRTRGSGDTVEMSLATLESYLDRRYVGDVTFAQVGQNDIVAQLIAAYIATGSNGGIPIRVQVVNGGAGMLRDRTYLDADDKTVYSVVTDLSAVIDGPQWTIGWEHLSNPERYTPVLYVGDRIGVPVPDGLAPAATFEIPGPVTGVSMDEDYSAGNGANDVMAVSTADGNTRPQSPHIVAVDPERPTFELRWTPSTSITDVGTLTGHAQAAGRALADGLKSVSLSANVAAAPKLRDDWNIGDDIGYGMGGLDENSHETVPAFPGGESGVARAIGWELTLTGTPVVTPILAEA